MMMMTYEFIQDRYMLCDFDFFYKKMKLETGKLKLKEKANFSSLPISFQFSSIQFTSF